MLKFSKQNAKTANLAKVDALIPYLSGGRKIYSLDLNSGYSCPGAKDCKSMAVINPLTGRGTIKDGPHCQYRCFSASQETTHPRVYKARKHNLDAIRGAKSVSGIVKLISESIPHNAGIVRLHVGGDFFSLNYLRAMVKVAETHPTILFYTYTKSLHHLKEVGGLNLSRGIIRHNFLVTASYGGKFDHLIEELGVRTVKVVFSQDTPLPIDHDDSHAALPGGNFAILIHGTQPSKSAASRAMSALKGVGSYSRKKKVKTFILESLTILTGSWINE